jgi:hypothetical protein
MDQRRAYGFGNCLGIIGGAKKTRGGDAGGARLILRNEKVFRRSKCLVIEWARANKALLEDS